MIESFVKTTAIQYQFQVTREGKKPTENGWVDTLPSLGPKEILWQRMRHVSDWAKTVVGFGGETNYAKAKEMGVPISEFMRHE